MASGTTAVAVDAGGGTAVSVGSGVEVNDDPPPPPQAPVIITTSIKHMTNLGRTNILQKIKIGRIIHAGANKKSRVAERGIFTDESAILT